MPVSRFTKAPWLWRAAALVPCCMLWLGACSTHSQRLVLPRQAFYTNDLPQAQTQLSKLASKRGGDTQVVELDLAMVELLQGNPAGAEQRMGRRFACLCQTSQLAYVSGQEENVPTIG